MRRHLLLTVLLVPCALGTTPALADVVPPVTLDGPSAQITAVSRVDVAADGTAALAWVKNGDVWASRYAGGAWSTPGPVADTTAPTRPVVAAAAGGRTVVAYTDGGSAWAVTSPGTGAAFGGPGKIADGPGWIDIDSAADGTTYATGATGGGNPDVFAWRQSAAGWDVVGAGALDANQALQAGGTNDHQPHVAAYPGGALMLWAEGDDATTDDVFFRRLAGTDPGTATQANLPSTTPLAGGTVTTESRMLDVAVTPSGDAWLAFRQDVDYGGTSRPRIVVRPVTTAAGLGAHQVADTLGTTPTEGAEYPRLALDGSGGGVLAAPTQLSGGTIAADLVGGAWTAFRAEATTSATVTAPSAAIGAEGTATVVWSRMPGMADVAVVARRRLGGTWGPEQPISDPAQDTVQSTTVSAAADAGGTAHVTFLQGGTDKRVQAARLDGPPAPPAPPGAGGGGGGGETPPAGGGTPAGGGAAGGPGAGPGVIVEPPARFAGATKVTLTGGTLRVRDGRARVTVRNANAFAVKAALRLRVAGRTLRATATLAPNARRTLRVTVPKQVRNGLGRSGRPAKLTLSVTDPAGTTRTVKATATLKRPR